MKMIKKAAPVFVMGAAILWGILVIFIKNLSSAGLESMEIVTLRVYGAALVLVTGLLLYNKKLLKIRIKDAWCFVGTGVVSIVFFSYCYFKNVTVSSVAVSSILMYTSPIWVTLFARVVFREKISRCKLVALGMAFIGCVLVSGITGGVGKVSAEGLLLGLGSGIGYGLYSIFGRIALDGLALKYHIPFGWRYHSGNSLKETALSAAVGPDDGGDFSFFKFHGNVMENLTFPIGN